MHVTRSKRSAAGLAAAIAALGLGLVGPATPVAAGVAAAPAAGGGCLTAPANARQMGGGDGTDPNSVTLAETKAMEAEFQAGVQTLQKRVAGRGNRHAGHQGIHYKGIHLPQHIKIDTYVHVITRADGTGDVTDKMIRDQIKVMNEGYAGKTSRDAAATPFRFKLKAVDRTANDDWYDWSNPDVDPSDDTEAKTALHRGTYQDLNVYVAGLGDNLLGYAYYPDEVPLWQDGLVLLNDSLPGGAAAPYNEGDTATHEIGHWLFLLHTFENGCTFPGDEVADTAYQLDGDNIFECDESLDTCAQPGTDPVHNFMSYGDDPCLDQFTRGQALRMTLAWLVFRAHR
jgi:hypothetical protein